MQVVEEKIRTVDGNLATKRYVVIEKVGQGAFSQCFRVQVLGSEQIFAMKIITKEKMALLQKEKLVEEIRIHQTLSHPSIVFLDHWFEDKSYQYIFLEYCAKKTLQERCKKYESLDERQIRRYGLQILSALKYLHSKLVLHRDLKLSNFFLDADDNIKLGDFGFACRLQDSTDRKREACGTPNYTAPEVISSIGYNDSADLWSFGVILFRMKFGACPFEMPQLRDTLNRIRTIDYAIPKWASISQELKDLILRLLVLDPQARPTIEEMQNHPFFQKSQLSSSKSTGGIRGLVTRLFSADKHDDRQRKDSCESKKDIKNIFREKNPDTTLNSNRDANTVLSKATEKATMNESGSKTDRPKSPKRSDSSNKERLLKLLKKDKGAEQGSRGPRTDRSSRKQSPPSRTQTLKLVDPTKINQDFPVKVIHNEQQTTTVTVPIAKQVMPIQIALASRPRDRSSDQPQMKSITMLNGHQSINPIPSSLINKKSAQVQSQPTDIQLPSSKPRSDFSTNATLNPDEPNINQLNPAKSISSNPARKMTSSQALLARLHAAKQRQTSFQQTDQSKPQQPSLKEFNMTFKPDQPPQLEGLSVMSSASKSEDIVSKRPDQTFGHNEVQLSEDNQPRTQRTYRTEVVAALESTEQISRLSENPVDRMHRLKNKAKQNQLTKQPPANSILHLYPFFLVQQVQVVNEHCLVYLTNGMRQIIKGKDIYSIFEPGRIFDRDGIQFKEPPKMIDYISREKLAPPYVPLTESGFRTLIERKHMISKWRVVQGKMVFALLSATAITTGKTGLYYLKTSQFEHLYSHKLEIVEDPEELNNCRLAYEQMQKARAQNESTTRSTSRNRKLLE